MTFLEHFQEFREFYSLNPLLEQKHLGWIETGFNDDTDVIQADSTRTWDRLH